MKWLIVILVIILVLIGAIGVGFGFAGALGAFEDDEMWRNNNEQDG